MENSLTELSQPATIFSANVHKGQSITIEYFLDNFYETVINIKQNGSMFHTANVDTKPHDIVQSGVNSTPFNIAWTVDIQSKCQRSGHLQWTQDPLTITINDNQGNIQFVSIPPAINFVHLNKMRSLTSASIKSFGCHAN
jgi:FlaG/FlaF family flagellin (archaellin)